MNPEQRITNQFGGPTPPPTVEKKVLAAAREARVSSVTPNTYGTSSNVDKVVKQKIETEQAMSDNIVFACPACGTKYNVGPHHAGKKTKCKKCEAAITVPTPQADNQTVIGVTRTIRRADIAPGSSAREAAAPPPVQVQAPPPATDVDMSGGSSVLRKGGTIAGGVRPVTAGPQARRSAPGHGPRPIQGRPAPHGQNPNGQPHGKKKGNTGLIIGIAAGVVAIILVVVIVVVGGGGGPTDSGQTDGTEDGGEPAQTKEQMIAADLKDQKMVHNDVDAQEISQIRAYYKDCDEKYKANGSHAGYKKMRDDWAEAMIEKSGSLGDLDEAKLIMEMADLGYSSAEDKYEGCKERITKAGHTTKQFKRKDDRGDTRVDTKAHPVFENLIKRLGWELYKTPPEFDTYNDYFLDSLDGYRNAVFGIPDEYTNVGLLPPELVASLKEAEKPVWEEAKVLEDQDKKDGYAITARQAFHRFLNANRGSRKVNIKKGKRAFSPTALGRGVKRNEDTNKIVDKGEKVEDVWTYTYAKPFIVYVEKPVGGADLDEDFLEDLQQKAKILRDVEKWFRANIVKPFGLKRVKPLGVPFTRKDASGKEVQIPLAQIAEEQGWPLELIVFKDGETFIDWASESTGSPLPVGARAFYSPRSSTVVTWDDRTSSSSEASDDNNETLVHEVFHQMSDHFATNPQDPENDSDQRFRYSTVLVQEGLTESIAAFEREGSGKNATYKFVVPNEGRIQFFFKFHDVFIGDFMFATIKDLVRVQHYGAIYPIFQARANAMKDKIKQKNLWMRFHRGDGLGMGIYYSAACMAGYFFYHYEVDGEYPYRDIWWEFIRQDYTDELADSKKIVGGRAQPDKVEAAFAEVFGLESDEDWAALDKEFWEFTLTLKDEYYDSDDDEIGDDQEASRGHEEFAMSGAGAKVYGWLRDEE